jgi:hypothetical protein
LAVAVLVPTTLVLCWPRAENQDDWLEVNGQPGGTTEHFTNLPLDRYITIVEGEGKWK